ncbi:phage baseplate assembly protein V [Microbacterium sp. W1N]|uniref:phage baseplate assembly protein V n=1 Tax=Microbacterium festucae TaxID=2977531 RepID=UPI0021C17CD1|nr:phage baseplate assembly protein V [Microbacterium festucae]MCT9819579.1 phage baseplate assembly protein V [Microbacterium festucae]
MAVHRAQISAADDPERQGRLQITIPTTGAQLWARAVVPFAAFATPLAEVGALVWVAYEDDHPDAPVVLGLVDPPPRTSTRARDLEALGDAWDRGHAAGAADADGTGPGDTPGDTPNPYR